MYYNSYILFVACLFVRSYRVRSRFVCSFAATAFAPAAAEQTLVYYVRYDTLSCAIISRFFASELLMLIPMRPVPVPAPASLASVVSVSSPVYLPT